jgi:hypothetical protein
VATAFDHPVTADFRWRRVRNGLTNLSTKGVEPWWIFTKTPALLELVSLDEIEKTLDGEEDRRPRALAALLKEIVDKFDGPRGKVLTICLALRDEYHDLEGQVHSLLDLGATERQILAGKEFRGKRGRIGGHAIRLNHLPEALDHLAVQVLYREISNTGFWRKGWPGPRETARFEPGATVPQSGAYETCDAHGVPTGRVVTLQEGEKFPPPLPETLEAGWLLAETSA